MTEILQQDIAAEIKSATETKSAMQADLSAINSFLLCATPQAWIDTALAQQDILLIDHAHCEKKAASTALNLLYRYPDRDKLLYRMSRLAREELRHFEQVLKIIHQRGIQYKHLNAARYASGMREHARKQEPYRLIDTLIIGAFIEARSCERFAAIAPLLDAELHKFYVGLLHSEARHFEHYLQLAELYSDADITPRVQLFAKVEQQLILEPDSEFRFHSGILL